MNFVINILIIFIVTFLADYLILKNLKKYKIDDYNYMKKRYKFKKKKNKNFKIISSLLNAFIMTLVCIFILYIRVPLIISIFISFVLLLLLIYSVYGIYGSILKKEEKKKIK